MKAAIYARFSTEHQNESSIDDQVRVCTERADRESWQVAAVYKDEGISGAAVGNRPGFLRMMEAAMAGTFDVLLVMELSRLSRNNGDLAKTIERLNHRGVRVIGVSNGYDSERKGHKLQVGLEGIMGEAFREMTAEKTYQGLLGRAHRGEATGGRAYGYIRQQSCARFSSATRRASPRGRLQRN